MDKKVFDFLEAEDRYRNFNNKQFRPLAQHSWEWQMILGNWPNQEWKLLAGVSGEDIIGCIPFCIKHSDIGSVLMSSPLPASYAGVLHINHCDEREVYKELLLALIDWARNNKINVITILTSPFREDIKLYREFFQPNYVYENFYQFLPSIDNLSDYIKTKVRRNISRNIKKAEKNNLSVVHGTELELVDQWYDILQSRLFDIGGKPIEKKFYFDLMKYLAPAGLAELSYITRNAEMIGGGIFLYGWCQDIFLRASSTVSLPLGTSTFLDYQGILRGISKGVNVHNFQSSSSKESFAYYYKQGWRCCESNTYYLVKILDDCKRFFVAGKDKVAREFPYYFVFPYSAYEV